MSLTTEQTSTIDEMVIEALRGQTRRYDVAIDEDFVLSVLPNGVKTWTWVHDDPGHPHRKTLGVYPEMSIEDARKSLAIEKNAYHRGLDKEPEFVIRDGQIQPVNPSIQAPVIIGATVTVIAVAVIALVLIDTDSDDVETVFDDDNSSFVTGPTKTPLQLPTASQTTALAEDAAASAPDSNTELHRDNETTQTIMASSAAQTKTTQTNTGLRYSRFSETNETSGQTAANLPPEPRPPAPGYTDVQNATPQVGENTAQPVETRLAKTVRPQTETPVALVNQSGDANTTTIIDSRVARGQLTTAVDSREPVDYLGTQIIGTGEDLQTYYFFTELRRLAGQRVRHRWIHQDQVIAEIPFNVGGAWRWRVYSSKTFLATMSGQWQVQVVLNDDTVIHSIPFTYTP